jgi:hypothetical protein
MLAYGLGKFGDFRLEKGGPSCTGAWLRWVVAGFGFAASAATGRGRCGSRAFCATPR